MMSFDESTVGSVRPGLHLDLDLQYFMELNDVQEMLAAFQTMPDGLLGMIQRNRSVNGETGLIDTVETIKPLEKFTLDQIKKIASKLGLARQKSKADYLTKLNEVVKNQLEVVIHSGSTRIEQQQAKLYNNSIIVMRFIGIVFHVSFSAACANLNDNKKRKEFENGFGPNNKRFFEKIANIINDDESNYHKEVLPLPNVIGKHDTGNLYSIRMNNVDTLERPTCKLAEPVQWSRLKQINALLHKVYQTMKKNMSESGSHDSDAFNYTGSALGKCAAITTITPTNMYYFYMQMVFNDKLCVANQTTLPENLRCTSADIGKLANGLNTPRNVSNVKKAKQSNKENNSSNANTIQNILSSIATRFDKQVEHDVAASMIDRSEKMSEKILESMRVQATFYSLLSTTTDPQRRKSIENKIDLLENEILTNQAMINEMRSGNNSTQQKTPCENSTQQKTPCENVNRDEEDRDDEDRDDIDPDDDSSVVSCHQNDDDSHISIVKITPPTMAVRINKILNQITVPKVIVPKECDDEVSCLHHQLEENKGITYSQYESPSLV